MIRSATRPAVCALFLALAGAPAAAQGLSAADPGGIARAIGETGADAELNTASDGSPVIASSAAGLNYLLHFHGCTEGADCTSLKFTVIVRFEQPPDLTAVNEWNRVTRYGKAHVGTEGELRVEYDVSTVGGLPPEGFAAALAIWEELLARLRRTVAG